MNALARFFCIMFIIIFAFQNSFLLFLRLKEGAGSLEAALSQISLICGIAILWSFYLLTRRFAKYHVLIVILIGTMLMIVYEIILPLSPSKAYMQLLRHQPAENNYQ